MLRVNNVLLDESKIVYVLQDRGNVNKITVVFLGDIKLEFKGAEAAELWSILDEDKGWQQKDD